MTSKPTISNSTRSAEVTFSYTVIGKFMYTHLAITRSPIGVEIEKSSERFYGLTLNWTAM